MIYMGEDVRNKGKFMPGQMAVWNGQAAAVIVHVGKDGDVYLRPENEEEFRRLLGSCFKFYAPGEVRKDERWKENTFAAHECWDVMRQSVVFSTSQG